MQARTDLERILNLHGDVAERIIPGLVGFETYFEHIERYRLGAKIADGRGVIIDLACGSGYGSYYLARQGFKQVVGIDHEEKVIGHAVDTYANPVSNLSFMPGDALDIPLHSSCVDAFVSFETIEHLVDPDQFLREVNRVLVQDGLLILSAPNKHLSTLRDEFNPYHISELFIEETYEKLASINFQATQVYGQGASARENSETAGDEKRTTAKSVTKSMLPDFAARILRQRWLLPRRTGIPNDVVAWYDSAPAQFENWVANNRIRTSYQPKPLRQSAIAEAKKMYNTFIIVARKGN